MKVDGMDDMQIREFALFLYVENQKKSKQLDDMIARLDEIGKDLKEARKQGKSESSEAASRERPYRKGMAYNKSVFGTLIVHKSDFSMLPEGAIVISSSYKKIRNIVSHIEEHHFEGLKVKHTDGRI